MMHAFSRRSDRGRSWVPVIVALLWVGSSSTHAVATEDRTVFYQIYVRAFYDSNGDGIGDLQGVIEKLDYLEDLGVGGIWLMPLFRAPTDHKYFSSDYDIVDPEYGTNADLANLVKAAHDRGMRVIIDFMVNHTSVKHKWFHASRRAYIQQAEGRERAGPSPYLNFYHWMKDSDPRTKNCENMRLDGSFDDSRLAHWKQGYSITGQPVGKYYSRFVDAPDLNYDNPLVRKEIIRVGKFWLTEIGVDGFRLDAARHIYDTENNQPVSNESRNSIWWSEFCAEMKRAKSDCLLIGEIWSQPKVMASYLQTGMDSVYDFALAEAIRRTVKSGTDAGVIRTVHEMDRLCRTQNPTYIDSTFLENHDFPRLMTMLNNDEAKVRLAVSILLTLPGRPFIYYGDELGLKCDKKLTWLAMPWAEGQQDAGQTRWMQSDRAWVEGVAPVSLQTKDDNSLHAHFKRLIQLRNAHPSLREGKVKTLDAGSAFLAYSAESQDERLLVIHNLSNQERVYHIPSEWSVHQVLLPNLKDTSNKRALSVPAFCTTVLKIDE